MKKEMFEFMIHLAGYESPLGIEYNPMTTYRHFGAPRNVPMMDRPFGPGYQTHPHLSRPVYAGAVVTGVPSVAAGLTATVYPFVLATATHPEVAGPQYQSAMSGQISIGSSALNMPRTESWTDFFSWSYWSGN